MLLQNCPKIVLLQRHGVSQTYLVFFFSPDGKRFRSRTELERYALEWGLDVDPETIDFTVRGRGNKPQPKPPKSAKRNSVKLKLASSPANKKAQTEKEKMKLLFAKKLEDDVKKLKSLKSPPKTNKTISQKLVVKMKFSPPVKKQKEKNSANSINGKGDQSPKVEKPTNKESKVKSVVHTPVNFEGAEKKELKKTNTSVKVKDKKKEKKKAKEEKQRANKKTSEKTNDKTDSPKPNQTHKNTVQVEKVTANEISKKRRHSSPVKLKDKAVVKKPRRRSDMLDRELQVMQNIKANSRSARYKQLQNDIKVSVTTADDDREDNSMDSEDDYPSFGVVDGQTDDDYGKQIFHNVSCFSGCMS